MRGKEAKTEAEEVEEMDDVSLGGPVTAGVLPNDVADLDDEDDFGLPHEDNADDEDDFIKTYGGLDMGDEPFSEDY